MTSNEADLLARLRAGDDEAFAELVSENTPRLLAVARRFMRNEEDARDAVQEGFLSAFKSIDRFEGGSKLSTWLHRIVVNACLMKLRSKKRKPERSIEDLLPGYQSDGHPEQFFEPWRETGEDAAARNEERELVRKYIDQLPDNYRNVLLLRDIEGIDTEETAQMLDLTPGAVKTRLHRARLALRELLDPHFRPEQSVYS
ncbi:MAG: sigma-70 family RNA polymerase sigma factor [Planctomycetota bacterium]